MQPCPTLQWSPPSALGLSWTNHRMLGGWNTVGTQYTCCMPDFNSWKSTDLPHRPRIWILILWSEKLNCYNMHKWDRCPSQSKPLFPLWFPQPQRTQFVNKLNHTVEICILIRNWRQHRPTYIFINVTLKNSSR